MIITLMKIRLSDLAVKVISSVEKGENATLGVAETDGGVSLYSTSKAYNDLITFFIGLCIEEGLSSEHIPFVVKHQYYRGKNHLIKLMLSEEFKIVEGKSYSRKPTLTLNFDDNLLKKLSFELKGK